MVPIKKYLLILGGGAFLTLPLCPEAKACHEIEICVAFEVAAVDNSTGNLGQQALVEASGTRVRLVAPDGEGARDRFLDETGCFLADTRHTRGLKLLVYPDSYVGVSGDVHITTYADYPAEQAGTIIPWRHDLLNVPLSGLDDPVIISGEMANMHGWILEVFHNVDQHAHLIGEHELHVHGDEFSPNQDWGAYASGERMMLGPIAQARKFIMAHEFGHWYQQRWTNSPLSGSYLYEDDDTEFDLVHAKDPDCDFANAVDVEVINDLHGIRSAEYADAAMGEGFAHFVAALAFNDVYMTAPPPQFEYYKDILLANQPSYWDLVAEDNYQIDLIGGANSSGGQIRWTETMCPADWNSPLLQEYEFLGNQISTEMDWLRFFWGFVADPDTNLDHWSSLPEFQQVMQLFEAAGLKGDDIYLVFQNAIDDPANVDIYEYRNRLADVAVKNGVQTND